MREEPGTRYTPRYHEAGKVGHDDELPEFGPLLTRLLNGAGYLAVAIGVVFFVCVWTGVLEVGR